MDYNRELNAVAATQVDYAVGVSLGKPLSGGRALKMRHLLSRCAAIPCLIAIEGGFVTQASIKELLKGRFAQDTVLEALKALTDDGMVVRRPANEGRRTVEYEITPDGLRLLNATLKEVFASLVFAKPPPSRIAADGPVVALQGGSSVELRSP